MTESDETFEQRVARTRARFIDNLPERIETIRQAARHTSDPGANETQQRKVHRLLHDMAGTAAMLELSAIETSVRRALHIAEEADVKNIPYDEESLFMIEVVLFDILSTARTEQSSDRIDNT